jgi:hypothetical protein
MKAHCIISAAIILAGLSSATAADYYNQYFDSMGTSGTTPPTGWSMRYIAGNGLNAAIPTSTEMDLFTSPGLATLAIWNQTDPPAAWTTQAGNMGSGPTDPNRLLGTSPTGSRGSILQLNLNNSSGSPVYRVQLSYDMYTMAAGVLSSGFDPGSIDELPGYSFYYLDGSTWTHLTSLDLSSAGTASAIFDYASPVANGGTMQFRWFDDNAYAYSPDTIYAIDNVNINIPEPGTLGLLAVGAAAMLWHRRKS